MASSLCYSFFMEVIYGSGKVSIYERQNGRWVLKWKEAGKVKSTTFSGTKAELKKKARGIAKEIDRAAGGKMITYAEIDLLERLQKMAGKSSGNAFLDQVESFLNAIPSEWSMKEAVDHLQSQSEQMALSSDVTVSEAYERLVDHYNATDASPYTFQNPRKEVKVYGEKFPELRVCDLTKEELIAWIDRGAPAPLHYNTRLATWKSFLSKCQDWKILDDERRHVLANEKKRKVPKKSPEILSLSQMKKAKPVLKKEINAVQAAFLIGSFAGLRPFEIKRLCWENIDFKNKYIHVTVDVSRKLIRERFVPMPANLVKKLQSLKSTGRVCKSHEWVRLITSLKEGKVIHEWPQDLLRHSFCSYRLAQSGDAAKVADEAGNSPDIVRNTYRRPLTKEEGDAWFK